MVSAVFPNKNASLWVVRFATAITAWFAFCFASQYFILAEGRAEPRKVVALQVGAEIPSQTFSGMGSISCPHILELGFDETGLISEILVEEGDNVGHGQVMARLDSSVLAAEKRAARARLASVEAELRYYQNELEKKEALYSKNALSDTDLKKAALDVEKAKASIEYTRAEIQTIETKMKKRILVAPCAGLVAKKHVDVGSVIMPGANKVITLIQCSKAWAET